MHMYVLCCIHLKFNRIAFNFFLAAIGVMHFKGEGCKKSKECALRWLKRSCDKGSIYGTGMLTQYYYSIKLYRNAIEIAQRYNAATFTNYCNYS